MDLTITGLPQLFGWISQNGSTLTAVSDQQPTIEQVTYADGTVEKRLCERSFTYNLQQ
jgi:hypothetical protein